MGNWEKMTDYEAEKLTDYKGRFTINFKKIYLDVDEISERTMEVNEKHPKDSLMKLWAGTMVGMFLFFLAGYHLVILCALPFLFFYLLALFRIGKCWKSFGYSAGKFWGMRIPLILVMFVAAQMLHMLIGKVL